MATTGQSGETLSMLLVMGVTGSGKSYFINKLANSNVVQEGDDLKSCTVHCAAVPVNIGRTKVMCIDTPGFDDTTRTDSQILEEISRILAMQYEAGISLKGVVYLHRITDIRWTGASVKTLEIFKKICGSLALKNVVLVTTRWSEVDAITGSQREQELRDDIWAYMLGNGANLARFTGQRESAIGIASQLISKQDIVLELQRELVDHKKPLNQTVAGSWVQNDLAEYKRQHQEELQGLEKLRQTLQENDRTLRRRVQENYLKEQQKLQTAHEDEERLRTQIGDVVRAEIEGKRKKNGSKFIYLVPLLPALVGLVELCCGIPPGSTALLASWFSESGLTESVSDFFANF